MIEYLPKEFGYREKLENIILPLNHAKEEKMEYKLLIEERSTLMEIQKKLNQWKHNYDIKILAMVPFGPENSGISLLILRSLKGENHGA